MVLIRNTNILVDDFEFSKRNEIFKNYVYILSHLHADHYKGLTNSFQCGKIYCSEDTGKVLSLKFPGIAENIIGLKLNQEYEIPLNENTGVTCTLVLLDANHILGSTMIFLKGYFGTVLHTGDFRWSRHLLNTNTYLFNKDATMKYKIDELIMDNTYCDPIFQFPAQQECIGYIKKIIDKNLPCRVKMFAYTIGKEEIAVQLARHYKTKIVVGPQRYKNMISLNFHPEMFTTNESQGFIHLESGINSKKAHTVLDENQSNETLIQINLSGWYNIKSYLSTKPNQYYVAYSSHSNYPELEDFLSIVKPGI